MSDLRERFRTLDRLAPPDLWADAEQRRPGTHLPGGSQRHRLVTAAVALVVAAAGIGLAARTFGGSEPGDTSHGAGAPLENGAIVYVSNGELWLVQPDGSEATKVDIDVPGFVGGLAWSPDGLRLALDVNSFPAEGAPKGGYHDVYTANADGSDAVRLTDQLGARLPTWSPDGSRIAYAYQGPDGGSQIFAMNADGSDPTQLTSGPAFSVRPAWSPEGSRIAFEWVLDRNADVYVMSADGSDLKRLTDDAASDGGPIWSPDGELIAFASERDPAGIYVMNADGSDPRLIEPDDDIANLNIAWSPDGRFLAFSSSRGPGFERAIYVLELSSGVVTQITDRGPLWGPAWQPVPATATTPSPTETATPTQSPPTLDPEVVATIPVGAFPRAVEVGDGSVWATVDNATGGPEGHLLVRIDPATNEIVETIPIGEAGDLAIGGGSLWVTSSQDGGVVLRIDPTTYEMLAAIPVGPGLSNVEFGLSAVWVTLNAGADPPSGEVVRIDPTTNDIVARVPVDEGWPRDIAIGEGSVWVYGHSRHTGDVWEASSLWRIDPVTNELVATVLDQVGFLGDGGFSPDNVAIGDGGVWAADDRGNGVRIDPATGALTRFEVEGGFSYPFMVYAGRVWFGLSTIGALDIRTLEVDATLVGEFYAVDTALDPATGTLWLANYEGSVTRIVLR